MSSQNKSYRHISTKRGECDVQLASQSETVYRHKARPRTPTPSAPPSHPVLAPSPVLLSSHRHVDGLSPPKLRTAVTFLFSASLGVQHRSGRLRSLVGITCSQQPLGDQVPSPGRRPRCCRSWNQAPRPEAEASCSDQQGWKVICEPRLAARVFSFSRALRCRVHSQEICS